ncbi:MAG: hypothetical protein LBR62_03425 [Puniceicoccales bacterium]|jgi:hypothetical protein|nr:hypothetical protein [Puniceicoccales bacterium]
MKKGFIIAISIMPFLQCYAKIETAIIQPRDAKLVWVDEKTSNVLTFEGELSHIGWNSVPNIPTTEEEFQKYETLYLSNSESTLTYATSFWMTIRKSAMALDYCCLDTYALSKWVNDINAFIRFVCQSGNFGFKIAVLNKCFKEWKERIDIVCEREKLSPNVLIPMEELKKQLTQLIECINQRRKLVTVTM